MVAQAAMNFGWDWGPRMVTVGIWGTVRLEKRTIAKLDNMYARTESVSSELAVLHVTADVKSVLSYRNRQKREQAVVATCNVRLLDRSGHEVAGVTELPVEGGIADTTLNVTSPQLWWTHDLGEPYLYTLEVTLFTDGVEVDRYSEPYGLRTIELALHNERGEDAFTFILNGVKVYAKGANWIPADHLIGAIPNSRYRELVELSVEGHMNIFACLGWWYI